MLFKQKNDVGCRNADFYPTHGVLLLEPLSQGHGSHDSVRPVRVRSSVDRASQGQIFLSTVDSNRVLSLPKYMSTLTGTLKKPLLWYVSCNVRMKCGAAAMACESTVLASTLAGRVSTGVIASMVTEGAGSTRCGREGWLTATTTATQAWPLS